MIYIFRYSVADADGVEPRCGRCRNIASLTVLRSSSYYTPLMQFYAVLCSFMQFWFLHHAWSLLVYRSISCMRRSPSPSVMVVGSGGLNRHHKFIAKMRGLYPDNVPVAILLGHYYGMNSNWAAALDQY
eukprot:8574892-Pyramimonas_sp.AAC.1